MSHSWKPIVVGVDASPEATAAAAAGWALADLAGAPCRLVHATPEPWNIPTTPNSFTLHPARADQTAIDSARVLMGEALEGKVPPAAARALDVRIGRAAAVVRDVAHEVDAGLVVLGGKHHSAIGRFVGGSTAHALVRTLDTPLLVAANLTIPPKRIVAAVDLSGAAEPTIRFAERFAELFGAALHLVHSVEPMPIAPEVPVGLYDSEAFERSKDYLERHVWPLATTPGATTNIRAGAAAEAITDEARAQRADLLVLGSHGRNWVDRILIGSVTERLLNALPTSLLIVPVVGPGAATARPKKAATRTRSRARIAETP